MDSKNSVIIMEVKKMNKIEKQFKKDFEKQKHVELSFDNAQLEENTKFTRHEFNPRHKKLIITFSIVGTVVTLVAVPALIVLSSLIHVADAVKLTKREYSMNEIKLIESNTFKKLNDIDYPSEASPTRSDISSECQEAYSNFSNNIYHSLVDTSKTDNMSCSLVGVYSVLNELYGAASTSELKSDLDSLLGTGENSRKTFYQQLMNANSYAVDKSTIQLKNSAFFTNNLDYSSQYVDYLTALYCEAYQLDFSKDADKIVQWVNQAVNSNDYINEEYLEVNNETVLYLLSTLYFKNAWSHKYLSKDNIEDDFHLSNGETVTATFMKHSYMADCYYDYDSYISVKDFYHNGYASITYLVPKSVDYNIFELTKNKNIFIEDEECIVSTADLQGPITVNLKTPKFSLTTDIDFKSCLTNLGFKDIFDSNIDSFKNAFTGPKIDQYNFYVQTFKQRNEVTFNEDGTTVKALTLAANGKASSASFNNLSVDLNQPFIYIIKDFNDEPIFVGHVDNPSA